jgi:hypothetical protein
MIATYRFRVCAPSDITKPRKGETPCVIGRDVQVDAEALENYCFQLLSEREYELALLAGVIAFADRTVRRLHSEGWARRIEIVMPVQRPDEWNACSLVLQELLQFLTGDHWHVEFIARRVLWGNSRQEVLPLGSGKFVVVPYSNGLDSFAQSQLLKLEAGGFTPIRITAWNRGLAGGRDWRIDPDGTKYRRVSIPIRISTTDHPEPTYRTRSFLFNVFAGIAAHLAQAESVIVPENGQGAIGPSIVPFGAESPQRGSHPGVTRRLGQFLGLVLEKPVRFQHPQLWRTKGEVLRLLKQENLLNGWTRTTSCPRDRRDVNLNRRAAHCGVCAGCLLRRSAAHASELEEPENTYLWSNLEATTLAGAIHPDSERKTRPNDVDIANHGVLVMAELAEWADSPGEDPVIAQTAFEISGAESMDVTLANLKRLLRAHRDEWNQFRNHFGPKSWINSNFAFL